MAPFLDPEHQDRFNQAVAALPAGSRRDLDWQATLFLLSGDAELWQMAQRYLRPAVSTFHWREMLRHEPITGRIGTLARLSAALYAGHGDLPISDLWLHLTGVDFSLALAAIWRRRTG